MSRPDLDVPGAPADDDRVFDEPWHAQAFALAVALHERGRFAWSQFVDELAATIRDDPDDEYYRSWLAALERVVVARGLTTDADLAEREDAWHRAARATPHGRPIVLDAAAVTARARPASRPGRGSPPDARSAATRHRPG